MITAKPTRACSRSLRIRLREMKEATMTLLAKGPASRRPAHSTELFDSDGAASRLDSGVAALASGRALVLCDDAIQPTSAELVYLAEHADVATTAFVIRHSSGFLQVALPTQRCDELGLSAQCGSSPSGIPQCVSVDSTTGIGTGISATDRAATIRLLASSSSVPQSFTRPGHVVPVRVDSGHACDNPYAAAALNLASLAGARPSAVLATLDGISDPLHSAAGSEILHFAYEHGLPLVGLADLDHGDDSVKSRCARLGNRVIRLRPRLPLRNLVLSNPSR